jgi:hypothetical protein
MSDDFFSQFQKIESSQKIDEKINDYYTQTSLAINDIKQQFAIVEETF